MSYDIADIEGLPAKERTWKVEIKTDPDTDYLIVAHREKVALAPTGVSVYRLFALPTQRRLSDIVAEEYTINGKTLTGLELATLISQIGDQWKLEDEANA